MFIDKAGQMMREMDRAKAPNPKGNNQVTVHDEPQPKSEYAQAKQDAGISDTQAKRWQKLADVPEKNSVHAEPSLSEYQEANRKKRVIEDF